MINIVGNKYYEINTNSPITHYVGISRIINNQGATLKRNISNQLSHIIWHLFE